MLLISCNWHAVHRTNRSGGCGRDGRAPAVSGHRRRPIVVFRRIGILPRQHVAKGAHFLSHFYVNPNRSFIGNGSIDLQRKKNETNGGRPTRNGRLEIKMSSGSGCRVAHRRRRGRPFQIGRPCSRPDVSVRRRRWRRDRKTVRSLSRKLLRRKDNNCRIADRYDFFFLFATTSVSDNRRRRSYIRANDSHTNILLYLTHLVLVLLL